MSDKEYTECCRKGDLKRIEELQNDVTFKTFTKQCIVAMENGHYDIVEYLVNLPNNNIYYKANNYYILKESCKQNLVNIVKKIVCSQDNEKFDNMIKTAYDHNAHDVILYLLQLTSIIPYYISCIYVNACTDKHDKLKQYIETIYKHFCFEKETEEIIIYEPLSETTFVH